MLGVSTEMKNSIEEIMKKMMQGFEKYNNTLMKFVEHSKEIESLIAQEERVKTKGKEHYSMGKK